MENSKLSNVYRGVIQDIVAVRPSLRAVNTFSIFLDDNPVPSLGQLYEVYKMFVGQYRGILEQAGYDADMLPSPNVPEINIELVKGDADNLHPHIFRISSRSTNTSLNEALKTIPTVKTHTSHKQWDIHAVPAIIPALRKVVKEYGPQIADDALTELRKLATEEPFLGAVRYGPRKTIDCELYITAGDFSEQLKRECDARLVDGQKLIYRMPAAKLANFIKLMNDSPYTFQLSTEIEKTFSGVRDAISWDGSMSGLAGISLDNLHTLTPAAYKRLVKAGFDNAQSVLMVAPRKYVDRSEPQLIASLSEGEEAALVATIKSVRVVRQRKMVTYTVSDGRTNTTVTYFNALWLANKFKEGDRVLIYGKVGSWGKGYPPKLGFSNPLMEHLTDSKLSIFGIYPQAKGVTTEDIRAAINELLDRLQTVGQSEDVLTAFRNLHQPNRLDEVEPARAKLAYEELLSMQVLLAVEKVATDSLSGIEHSPANKVIDEAIRTLPYPLTRAQARAWAEISKDMSASRPMHRLLQGDVGSGKTTIALLSIVQAISSGRQAAVLAPTEILASQLFANFSEALHNLHENGILRDANIKLFTNKLRGKARDEAFQSLSDGTINIAVGTHALLSEGVLFNDLGLVIVDEQHRFGVQQRAQLSESRPDGLRPDTLVMTATPIPRTAALTVFGALEVSTLDELPPGRQPIETIWIDSAVSLDSSRSKAWKAVREAVGRGEQAYVVCPLVEESESLNVASATETYEALRSGALSDISLGLVHGQMKFDERSEVMHDFRDGKISVLVATTVIEVGVNVPNASTIVILDPQRFGMAQLHQLRGRVGRSDIASRCFLYGKAASDDSRKRLQALTDSTDGFLLSEIDLEIRGPGQLFGSAQSGITDLNLADLQSDAPLLEDAKQEAALLVADSEEEKIRRYAHESALSDIAADWLRKS
jgi:ATP-dependent DNA helicase RecG